MRSSRLALTAGNRPRAGRRSRVAICAVYVGGWWGLFATGLDVGPVSGSSAGLVGLPVISAMAVGATVGRWWAPGLPLLVVPVLALPWGYTEGAPPDYGIGFFVAAGFLLLSIPATLVGFGGTIAVRRRRR